MVNILVGVVNILVGVVNMSLTIIVSLVLLRKKSCPGCSCVVTVHFAPTVNTQLGKLCQELLMSVATNCTTHQSDDLKVIESLLAVRLKTKLFSNQFVGCIRYKVLRLQIMKKLRECILF